MGVEAEQKENASERLIVAGRGLLAQGDARFSLTRLCSEAGVTLEEFRASFTSKAALLQQLMDQPKPQAAPLPAADPWLERRLRVFERALNALEEKSDKRDREQRQTIALLEEQVAALKGADRSLEAPVAAATPQIVPAPDAAKSEAEAELESGTETKAEIDAETESETETDTVPANPLLLAPLEPEPLPRLDGEFLEAGRRAALAHARALERAPRRRSVSTRMLVTCGLAAVTLLVCATLTLVRADYVQPLHQATAHRIAATTLLAQLRARADSGEPAAERKLALAYLRGDGVAKDMTAAARWAQAAAEGGDPQAQYLIGSLSRDGVGIKRDPVRAFAWFAKAAAAGQAKAMHNLAIAYIQGLGTAENDAAAASWFARAAARGYVDSAFDLAVLYEKGQGVAQDARQALRWYRIAAQAGDTQAAARARILAEQTHL